MSSFNDKEYLDLIQSLVDKQYDTAIDDYDISKMEWMPSEPVAKEKLIVANNNGSIDLTSIKAVNIKEHVFKCTNLKVGNFKIRINRYNGVPSKDGTRIALSIKVWEEVFKTPNGHPCKMDMPLIFYKDTRFNTRPWLTYFERGSYATNIPVDTVVEIVRWMQAVHKMSAFL